MIVRVFGKIFRSEQITIFILRFSQSLEGYPSVKSFQGTFRVMVVLCLNAIAFQVRRIFLNRRGYFVMLRVH